MCIESIDNLYENEGLAALFTFPMISTNWNGREIQNLSKGHIMAGDMSRFPLIQSVYQTTLKKAYGNYVIGNVPIGVCPRGHVAYHIYQQPPYDSILLCDFKGDRCEERCPFELYKFMRLVGSGK